MNGYVTKKACSSVKLGERLIKLRVLSYLQVICIRLHCIGYNLTKYEISRFTVTGGDKGRIADGQITWTIRRLLRLDAAKTVIN